MGPGLTYKISFSSILLTASVLYYVFYLQDSKPMYTTTWIIGLLLFALTLAIIISTIVSYLKSLKGQIQISFDNKPYQLGDPLDGTIELSVLQPLEAESLKIRFYAEERRRQNDRTVYKTIWKEDVLIDLPKSLSPGSYSYPFLFTVPGEADKEAGLLERAFDHILSGSTTWFLEVRLSIPGLDLTATEVINVRDGDLFD